MNPFNTPLLLFVLTWLTACGNTGARPAALVPAPSDSIPPTLLLVSLDGVHPDQLGRGNTPTLDRLAREGVQAEWMRPSYPSLTFPNHYTLVTGLRPDRHGIVHNTMRDDDLGSFTLSNRDAVGDGRWWGGEPLWISAERAGLPTATLSWPGSEADVQGIRPTRWHLFDADRPKTERIEMVLGWLNESDDTRPRFATLYFEHPDSAAHAYGPDSTQMHEAMAMVDAMMGQLLEGIERNGLDDRVNMVIVSDHGMAAVPAGQRIAIEDMVAPDIAEVVSAGQVVGFAPLPGRIAAAESALLGAHDQYDCWRKQELPGRWHYGLHPRVPAIVCQMHEGWDAVPGSFLERIPQRTRGSHGYDPALPSMRAIFIAHGPAFHGGLRLPGFDNVDVYPLLADLLGVAPAEHDGDAQTLRAALRDP